MVMADLTARTRLVWSGLALIVPGFLNPRERRSGDQLSLGV